MTNAAPPFTVAVTVGETMMVRHLTVNVATVVSAYLPCQLAKLRSSPDWWVSRDNGSFVLHVSCNEQIARQINFYIDGICDTLTCATLKEPA